MPLPAVDFERSIDKQRLCFKHAGFSVVNRVFTWLMGLVIIFVAAIPFIDKQTHLTLPLGCISGIIFVWMIANLLLIDALVKVSGSNINNNRKNIIDSFNEVYDNLELNDAGQRIIRHISYSNPRSFYTNKRGKVITILFDENNVFLNITSLFRGDSSSPVNGWYNYLKCKQIAKIFLAK